MEFFRKIIYELFSKWRLAPERRRQRFLRELDYASIHAAYEKYSLAIITDIAEELQFPQNEQPEVSIIIPVYNQYQFTMRCLQSILACTDDVSYEIILADDNSTDATATIHEKVSNITVVKNTGPKGFLHNCNHAANFAKGEYLYFLNNDTQVFPKTVSSLAKVLREDQTVAIAGSKCVKSNSKLQAAGAYWGRGTYEHGHSIGQDDNPLKEEYNLFKYVDYCIGAGLMVRHSFWIEEKGFDERYAPGYYEDIDLCAKAAHRGLKVAYQPASELIHFGGESFGTQAKLLGKANREKFHKKWRKFLKNRTT